MASHHEIYKEIIELSKSGNSKAQKQLYQLYAKAMFNICFRLMNDWQDAEDMLQEVFIEAFTKLHTFRFESTFGAWLKRITVNKCINALKKKKISLLYEENLPDHISEDIPDRDLPDLSVGAVTQAMKSLPEGYRVIFSLYLLEGYDHVEISQILGISEATSKSQYSRAKKRIREFIIQKNHVGKT